MIESLHHELSQLELKHHELGELVNGSIVLTAKSTEPESISEVIRINELAAEFRLIAKWDGENIRIQR
ncbi:MAG: hypothetical protein ABFR02_02685 [Campylobacterota bacterium]